MYAIIETGGKQYKVQEGKYIDVELLPIKENETVEFDKVLMIVDKEVIIGQPFIENRKIIGKVLKHGKSKKIIVYKMRPKKHYQRKRGHRQQFTRVLIEKIV